MTTSMPRLCYFSRSADAKPGKGKHENGSPCDFPYLDNDFRKVLSNFHHSPFTCDLSAILIDKLSSDTKWNTIEHAFQGTKFLYLSEIATDPKRKAQLRTAGLRFCSNFGDPIGLGDGKIAQKNRKVVMLTPHELTHWGEYADHVMEVVSAPAYFQCSDRMRVLINTNDAELVHIQTQRGKPSVLVKATHLEKIRDQARNEPALKRMKS